MNNYALITGASSGIGRSFAIELAKQNELSLILTARRTELLVSLKTEIEAIWPKDTKLQVKLFSYDLSAHNQRQSLINSCNQHKITLLINNAGYGSVTEFSKSDLEWELNMLSLNCQALLHLTHHFGLTMAKNHLETKELGKIINISSVASFQPMPYMATYAATKAFVTSFSLALSKEKGLKGVDVLAVCPGPTQSEFHLVSGLSDKMTYLPNMTAEEVVIQALEASKKRRNLLICGWKNFVMSQLSRLLPRSASAKIVELVLREQVAGKTKWSTNLDK